MHSSRITTISSKNVSSATSVAVDLVLKFRHQLNSTNQNKRLKTLRSQALLQESHFIKLEPLDHELKKEVLMVREYEFSNIEPGLERNKPQPV